MGSLYCPSDWNEEADGIYQAFIAAHEGRLRDLRVPECKWRTLCKKLSSSTFDAGDNFIFSYSESDDDNTDAPSSLRVYTKHSMTYEDPENIYLIDHAWTYTVGSAKKMLEENSDLVERMASLMEVARGEQQQSNSELVESILEKMWLFNNCYRVKRETDGSSMTCWYILDEFGSRIGYSSEPTFEVVPFFSATDFSMYSLLFPKVNICAGDEVTTLFPGYDESFSDDMKMAVKYPWVFNDFSHLDFNLSEPPVEYFSSGRLQDALPDSEWKPSLTEVSSQKQLTVYSAFSDVNEFLTHSCFKIVDDKDCANILWLAERKNIRELVEASPDFCYISQFPSEQILTNKDLLAAVCRRGQETVFNFDTLESYPEWLPATFNLSTELPKFISYFQNRKKKDMENTWICKPFNLARGMDIHVTDNILQIIRLANNRSMVACKYLTDSVLFPSEGKGLVKMDLRYIVLLKSTDPLEVYVYDRFWIRFANKPFALEDFGDYERHFTVMNYVDAPLQQMYCHDFIQKFEDHYTSHKWSEIQDKINKMIKNVFVTATLKEPPAGLGKFRGSRAVYGLDIMLQWDRNHSVPEIKPVLLEVNWMPDCKRACQYYSDFYNDVFSVLFLADIKDKHVTLL